MAKFTMKDYENYMKEEERQARLQEELEIEASESATNWQEDFQKWQEKQEEEKRLEEMRRNSDSDWDYDWDYDYDDDYYCDDDDEEYDVDACYLYPRCDSCSCYPCQYFLEMQSLDEDINDVEFERIGRKSASRNRHLNNIKAKKRAQKAAEILEKRYQRLHPKTQYEEYRLYTRQAAAVKKAARVKVS